MTDTVTRLMEMIREIDEILAADQINSDDELDKYSTYLYKKRQALQDELTQLLTLLTDAQTTKYLRHGRVYTTEDICWWSFEQGVKLAEKQHSIGVKK